MKRIDPQDENGPQPMFAMTYLQISREIGISPEAVERTIRRAMKKIRVQFRRRRVKLKDYVTEGE